MANQEPVEHAAQIISKGNSTFDYNLHRILSNNSDNNLIYSPFSLSAVLAMAKCGARGATSLELEQVCQFPKNDKVLTVGYKQLLNTISINKIQGLVLVAANSLYIKRGFRIKEQFQATMRDYFGLDEVGQLDFKRKGQAAAEINAWVERVTRGKIRDLISPDSFNSETRMVLVNGVYFKGRWETPFHKGDTEKGTFHITPGVDNHYDDNKPKPKSKRRRLVGEVQVDMMNLKKRLPHTRLEHCAVLELPYEGYRVSMLIFLPHQHQGGIGGLLKEQINHEKLFSQMNSAAQVELSLPKFRVESTHWLVEPLKELGLVTLFQEEGEKGEGSAAAADLSGITADERLAVSEVIQKAFIKVDEEGTEAAAVTRVNVRRMRCSRPVTPPPVIIFNVDHPFMFQIIYKPNNLVLFSGCVTNPLLSG